MIHSDILATNPVPDEATLPLRDQLSRLISGLDARFMQAGTALATSVEAIERIAAALTGIGAAAESADGADAVETLVGVARRLSDLPRQREGRSRDFAVVQSSASGLRGAIGDVLDTLRVLRIYGMNVKIAASGADEFVGFVDIMFVRITGGEENVKTFNKRLSELRESMAGTEKMDRLLMAECARVVPQVPDRLVREADDLLGHQRAVAAVAATARKLALSIQGKVGAALGALQVGDITRQRLEHVLGGIQLLHAHQADWTADAQAGKWATAHLLRLFATQLIEAAQQFEDQAGLLIASLDAIGPDARQLLMLRTNGAAAEGRTFLRRLEESIASVEAVTAQLGDADRQTGAIVSMIADTVDELTRRLAEIRGVQLDVQQMAINIGLRCRRMEAIGKPVTVIAKEIRGQSGALDATTEAIGREMATLASVAHSIRTAAGEQGVDVQQALASSIESVLASAIRTEQAIDSAGDDADRVVDMLNSTATELREELCLSGTMSAMGDALHAMMPPAQAEPPEGVLAMLNMLLPQIGKLYTMASEREVHQRFLLPGMQAVHEEPAAGSEDDDLFDDGLF
ncbi:hypothetical protein SAMN05192583_0664 [Sphingomonas gellani]|uniref:HPt domain-containing protein n=1 Tax=Sphingomonas gellani TaxID=1166340 RepID=A0A1H7ZEY0_9SPHN|nr:hypothetical protein [Sphingomonas gellani]SEM56801.1 hypothetical protein SAMN05192583_0664 [Sphingomonas gellani]